MAKCKIPFFEEGQPFDPVLYPEDLADYDQQELDATVAADAALAKSKASGSPEDKVAATRAAIKARGDVLALQVAFVKKVLSQTRPEAKVKARLTVAEARHAFFELYGKGQDWRVDDEGARPLGRSGESSPPSASQG